MQTIKNLFTIEVAKKVASVLFVILVTYQAGIITGWFLRSDDQGRIQHEAKILVEQLKTTEQK